MSLPSVPIIDFDDQAIEFLPESHRTPRFIAWQQAMLDGSIKWLNENFLKYCYGDDLSPVWLVSGAYNLNDTVITYNGTYISTINGNIGNNPDLTPFYLDTITYPLGFSVIYLNQIYISKVAIGTPETFDPSHWDSLTGSVWYKIAPSKVGAQERTLYTSQKLNMEYGLNRYFRTIFRTPITIISGGYTPRPDIFIDTLNVVSTSFVVYPTEVGSSHVYPTVSDGTYIYPTPIYSTASSFKFQVSIPSLLAFNLGVNYELIIRNKVDLVNPCGIEYVVVIY